jgi:predicted outer membrane repeat protein
MKSFVCAVLIQVIGLVLVLPFNPSHAGTAPRSRGGHMIPFTGSVSAPLTSYTVTNLSDSGPGSLRQAIADANYNAGMDAITIGITGTITLTSGELSIEDDLNIIGSGATSLTINGNNASRVFQNRATVTISGLTISNGNVAGGIGGGIVSHGMLTITDCILSHNSAGTGCGIFNEGVTTITNSTISGNITSGSGLGGGAIYNHLGLVSVSNSTLSGNSASNLDGGAIYNDRGTVTVINTTLSGNSAKRAGGGIYTLSETLTITNCTLSNNSAASGGGIGNDGTVKIKNSIVANSTLGNNYAGTRIINVSGENFSTDNSCPGFTQVPSMGTGGLNLSPLQNNGSTTQTHALLPGSVAIDAATDCTDVDGNPVSTDQRGVSRPQDGDGDGILRCDVGAYEAQPLVPFDLCVQDESNGNLFQINTATGEYQFTNCGGLTIGGTGTLTKRGNQIALQHNASDRRVMASLDSSTKRATASIQLFAQGRTFSITDRDISNSTCACR